MQWLLGCLLLEGNFYLGGEFGGAEADLIFIRDDLLDVLLEDDGFDVLGCAVVEEGTDGDECAFLFGVQSVELFLLNHHDTII